MKKIEMILTGKFEELRRSVFEKKLDNSGEGTYTEPLSAEEECELVNQVLKHTPESEKFLLDYLEHYPINNKAVNMLISQAVDSDIKQILLKEFELYGYNVEQGLGICQAVGSTDSLFMRRFCGYGRIFYEDLYLRLSLIEAGGSFGEIYKKAVDKYRKQKP